MLRGDPIFFVYRRFIIECGIAEASPRLGVEHLNLGGHQLHGIGIAGDDNGLDILLTCLPAEGTQNIICLIALELKDGDVKGAHQLPYTP